MRGNRVINALVRAWYWVLCAFAVTGFIATLRALGLELLEALSILVLIGLGVLLYLLVIPVGTGLREIEKTLDTGFKDLKTLLSKGNPHSSYHHNWNREEKGRDGGEPKPSGAGAVGGMLVGVAIGAPFGPLGLLLGG